MTATEYQQKRQRHIESVEAMNLFHDYKPQVRNAGRGCYDRHGNYFPSLVGAAAAYGVTSPEIIRRIKSGQWRYA